MPIAIARPVREPQQEDEDQRGTGFSMPGVVAGYSFPYCQYSKPGQPLNDFKDLYPVRIDLGIGQLVEVQFSAFGRGDFEYWVLADPICDELLDSYRAVKTPWEEVDPGSIDKHSWYTLFASTVFRARAKGIHTFWPRIRKLDNGYYAIHHQNILVRVLSPTGATTFLGAWPST
jgi:hypothetical protein